MGDGRLTPEQAQRLRRILLQHVAARVAQEVLNELLREPVPATGDVDEARARARAAVRRRVG